MTGQQAQNRLHRPSSVPPPPGRRESLRGHRRIATLLMFGLAVGLEGCGSGSASSAATTAPGTTASETIAPATTQSASAPAASRQSPASSQAGTGNPVDQDALKKAWACGLSAGLEKLKALGPDGKNLYDAIWVTLAGRNLAASSTDLVKAGIEFGLDIVPLGNCFEPYFFPPSGGGGAAPEAPTGLTVRSDPNNGTVLVLTWNYSSDNVLYFVVGNGVEERNAPVQSSTGAVSYTWTGLKPDSWTCFHVRASNGDMPSDWDPNAPPWYTCAYSSSAQPALTNKCVFLLPGQVNCTNSDPAVALEGENVGDTSGCTFSGQITWGDGSQQTVRYQGANGTPSFVASHTYRHRGTYSIALNPSVVSGGCGTFNGSYTFTYS